MRAQSEVDLVIRQGTSLQAYEIKWSPVRRIIGRAFQEAYGTEVRPIHPDNPFVAEIIQPTP